MFAAFIYDISPPCLHDWDVRNTANTDKLLINRPVFDMIRM